MRSRNGFNIRFRNSCTLIRQCLSTHVAPHVLNTLQQLSNVGHYPAPPLPLLLQALQLLLVQIGSHILSVGIRPDNMLFVDPVIVDHAAPPRLPSGQARPHAAYAIPCHQESIPAEDSPVAFLNFSLILLRKQIVRAAGEDRELYKDHSVYCPLEADSCATSPV